MAYKWNKKRQRYIVTLRQGRDPVTGKSKRFYKSVRTKEEAEALDHEVRGHKLQNIIIPSSKTTLKNYIEDSFLPGYCQIKVRERTRQGYESIINSHILPALGYMRLVDITTERIDRFYAGLLQAGLSKTTVHHIHAVLRLILDQARKNKYLIINPAIDASAPGIERAEIQSFDFDQAARFMEVAQDSFYFNLYRVAINTGMRRSELCGLKWSDIDFNLSRIAVRRVVYRIRGQGLVVAEPKTKKSNRLIPMTDELAGIFQEHKGWMNWRMMEGLHRPIQDDDFVFLNVALGPQDPDRVGRDFHRIVTENDLGSITLHGLRHTFATLARETGMDIKDISDILGHSTTATTTDIYQHSKVWLQKEALQDFSLKLNKGGNKA